MKKSKYIVACLIGLIFLASCKKDPVAPTISVYVGEECVTENAHVYSGDEVLVGFTCTGENLTKIDIVFSQDGTVLASYSDDLNGQKNDPVSSYICKHNFVIRTSGTVTVTGTVTDASGQTASKSFNIHYDEKPNSKFVGDYEGNALFTGTMEASIAGLDPMQEEVTDHETPIILGITEGENINEVVITCRVNDQESTATGIVEGNKIIVELTDVPYTFDYDMNGFSISPTMTMNLNLTATLVDGQLNLDGTCNGDGEIHIFLYNGTITIDGTIGGNLNKLPLIG